MSSDPRIAMSTLTQVDDARGAPKLRPGRTWPRYLPQSWRPLLWLLGAGCIPVLLLAGWMAFQAANEQRRAALRHANETVDRVGERITAELAIQVQVAEALSLSASLDSPDLASFYQEALRLKQTRPLWATIELDDLSGTQLMNLFRPLGEPLGPTADRDSFDAAIHDRQPVIGGIGPVGPVSGRHLVALRVPVLRNGVLRFVLTVQMAPDAVSAIVSGAALPEGWISAVADRRGKLIARSLSEQATQGRDAAPTLRAASSVATGGFYKGTTLEGLPVDVVFRTLPKAGTWSVHLGIPSEELDGPTRHALYGVGIAVAISLTLAALLTAAVSRHLARQHMDEGRRSAAALAASEGRVALAVAAADLGTWTWDWVSDRVTGSDRCRFLLDLKQDDGDVAHWPSATFLDAIDEGDRDHVRRAAASCLEKPEPFEVNFRARSRDGHVRWLNIRGRRDIAVAGSAVSGILADIGVLKRAEAERLDLVRRLADAQEDVQRRIARDLHDQVGQTVTGLSLGLKGLEQALDGLDGAVPVAGPTLGDRVRWLLGLTSDIGRDLHRAAADLRPAALDDLGLPRALDALVADWSDRYGVSADVQVIGSVEPRLPEAVQTVLYRVVQEALTNVLKHACATTVGIVFERRQDEIRIVVEDDGVGFDVDVVGSAGRRPLGLSGMRERLGMVGGVLRIESSPGAGTTLFINIKSTSLETACEGS